MGQFRKIKDLMDWLYLKADEANPPTNENCPIGPYFFLLLFFSFEKCFLFVRGGSFTIRISAKKMLFLRTYVDY